jgi:hypothetical protein
MRESLMSSIDLHQRRPDIGHLSGTLAYHPGRWIICQLPGACSASLPLWWRR